MRKIQQLQHMLHWKINANGDIADTYVSSIHVSMQVWLHDIEHLHVRDHVIKQQQGHAYHTRII